MNFLLPAISLGFLGSFHCVGMCGPIALSLPVNSGSAIHKVTGSMLYNLGRVSTYALFGTWFGLLGQSIVFAGFQQALSITLGVLILLAILLPRQVTKRMQVTSFFYQGVLRIKKSLGTLLGNRSNSSLYLIGILNGLLPCGLVYLGIAGAIATGNPLQGALFMAFFGLGTLPAMLTLSLIRTSIDNNTRQKINRYVPVFIGMMAVLLVLRGLNLGIPYISPKLLVEKNITLTCCHK